MLRTIQFDDADRAAQRIAMNTGRIAEIIAAHRARRGPLLPILHDIQHEFGCIDQQAEAQVALALNLSRAEVHGVVSFYHDFTVKPDPRPKVELCRAEACKARGAEALVAAAEAAAGERVNLAAVYCLGLCSMGPNARIGAEVHSALDEAALVDLVKSA